MLVDLNAHSGRRVPQQLGLLVQKAMENSVSRERTAKNGKTGAFFDQQRMAGYLRGMFAAGLEKPLGTAQFPLLDKAYELSPLGQVIIAVRQAQIRYLARLLTPTNKNIGLTIKHDFEDDSNFTTTQDSMRDRKMAAMDRLNKACNTDVHPGGFSNWAVSITPDHLLYDRVPMVKQRNFRGHPISFHSIDPQTVRPIIEVLIPYAFKVATETDGGKANVGANLRAMLFMESYKWRVEALEQLSYQWGMDFTTASYVQIINNLPMECWKKDEMSILISNQSTKINRMHYGKSCFEYALELTDMFLTLWQYNKGQFNQEYPENMLILQGDYDDESLDDFKNQLKNAGRNQDKRLAIISADEHSGNAQVAKLREAPREMAFIEMVQLIVNLFCACFRLDPTTINFKDMGGGQVNFQQAKTEEMRVGMAQEEGLHGLVQLYCDWLSTEIIKPAYPELVVAPLNLAREDEETRVKNQSQRSWATINEARAADGLKPLPKSDKRGEMLYTPDGVQLENLVMQKEMQEQQAQTQGGGDGQTFDQMHDPQGGAQGQQGAPPQQQGQGGPPPQGGQPGQQQGAPPAQGAQQSGGGADSQVPVPPGVPPGGEDESVQKSAVVRRPHQGFSLELELEAVR